MTAADETPLLPEVLRAYPYPWDNGFVWTSEKEDEETLAYARAVLEACLPPEPLATTGFQEVWTRRITAWIAEQTLYWCGSWSTTRPPSRPGSWTSPSSTSGAAWQPRKPWARSAGNEAKNLRIQSCVTAFIEESP